MRVRLATFRSVSAGFDAADERVAMHTERAGTSVHAALLGESSNEQKTLRAGVCAWLQPSLTVKLPPELL